jgi:nitrogen regulatory protein PII
MSKKIMALLSIVEQGKGKKLIKELKNIKVGVNFQIVGFGTAPTEMMDIFGLGTNVKDIIISLGANDDIKDMMSKFGEIFQSHSKFGGIMIVLDVSAASRVLTEILNFNNNQNTEREAVNMQNENRNNLIVISVNEGYSEDVMHVARKAGATGGTVIKGRLADIEQFAEFMDTKVDGEREMLYILAPSKASKQIMEDVNREFGLTSSANGTIFALPAEKAFKI